MEGHDFSRAVNVLKIPLIGLYPEASAAKAVAIEKPFYFGTDESVPFPKQESHQILRPPRWAQDDKEQLATGTRCKIVVLFICTLAV